MERFAGIARRVPPLVADALLGCWIFGVGTYQLVQYQSLYPVSLRPPALGLLAAATIGVALRRARLWLAYAFVMGATIVGLVSQATVFPDSSGALLAQLVLLYTVAERWSLWPSIVSLLAELVVLYLARRTDGVTVLGLIQAEYSYVFLAWFAGRAQARRLRIGVDLDRTALDLRNERDRLMRSAVASERVRVARDLHSLVVRGVERMNAATIQARAHLYGLEEAAGEAIGAIESAGRQTLEAMRRLLTVLRRRDDGLTALTPTGWPEDATSRPEDAARPRALPGVLAGLRKWIVRPRVADALVVAAMAILAVAEPYTQPWNYDPRTYVPLATIVVLALLFRRRVPICVLLLVAVVAFAWNTFWTGTAYTADRAMVIAVYSVALFRGGWSIVLAMLVQIVAYAPLDRIPDSCDVPCQLTWTTQFLFAVVAASAVREGQRLNALLQGQTEVLRMTKVERARRAVEVERTRIARDVHDLVAHGVTLMVIQAGAARWLVGTDRPRADEALRSVQRAGQQSLQELQSLLSSLDVSTNDPVDRLPTKERVSVAGLVDDAVREGMPVELLVEGVPRQLDLGLELSLYRIVQEALTNVRKHAAGARTRVKVAYSQRGVDVEVTNAAATGPPTLDVLPGTGQGLIGIAERAALFGGRAEAGRTADKGFCVRASLAVEDGGTSDLTSATAGPA
jgi:signal transduction histidine kinase